MKTAKVLGMLLPLLGLAASAPAAAVTWGTTTSVSVTSAGATIYCGSTNDLCNTTGSGLTGSVMSMRGYSTPTAITSNTSPSEVGNWLNAQLAIYGTSGVGITNTAQASSGDAGTPQHAIDNFGATDVLVVDFGSNNWDVSSFTLGYMCNMGTSYGTNCYAGTNINVDAWVGNTNPTAFSGSTITGFTSLVLTNDSSTNTLRSDMTGSNPLGRYLVITGSLASYTDSFKITGISATQNTPPPPPTGVPLPGTVWLFMLGLMALGFASSRRPAMVRRAVR